MSSSDWPVPRLPVFGWQAWRGSRSSDQPCLLDLPNCHLTTSGRASITLALEVLGVQPGEPVLLPTYHCTTMVAPAVELRGTPRFYPIDATGGPDLAWLGQQDLSGVRVMLAAHFFGLPQPMARLREWCSSRGIALVEDCAHALIGRSDGQPVGSWGDIAIGSLTKFLPVPDGGCLVLNRGQAMPELTPCSTADQLKACLDIVEEGARHGRLNGLNRLVCVPLGLQRRLRFMAHRLSVRTAAAEAARADDRSADIQSGYAVDMALAHRRLQTACSWLVSRLPRQRIAVRRRENYRLLADRLTGHAGFHPLMPRLPDGAVPYVFPLWVQSPDPGYAMMRSARMPVFRWDRQWPGVPTIDGDQGPGWAHHVIQIACHQDASEADLHRIVDHVTRIYGEAC